MGAHAGGLLRTLEFYGWDAGVRALARPSPVTERIVLIELDQNSLDWGAKENGWSWPWPREVYGVILDFCKRANAATVSFDVLYSEPSLYGVDDDRALAESGRKNGRLLLSFVLGQETGNRADWPEAFPGFSPSIAVDWRVSPQDFPTMARASFPTPDVSAGAAGLGMVNQNPDPDGTFRAIRPLVFFAGRPVPTLSLAAYLLDTPGTMVSSEAGRFTLGSPGKPVVAIPLDSGHRAILNFRGKAGTYQSYSAAAVIQSELRLREGLTPVLSPDALRGKHVLFGFTAPALLDLRPAPPGGVFTGLELHATALDNLLAGDFFRPVPTGLALLLTLALCLAAAFFALRAARLHRLILTCAVFLALPVLLFWGAYRATYQLPLMTPLTGTFLALAFSVAVAYATEGRQRRFLKNAFSQYLSPEVITEIIKDPAKLKLGGERRVISIFFSDLAGFSTFSETLSPEELTKLLNDYLSAMTDVILQEGGTIDKYEGDAIIAFWNAPQPQEDHAARALRAALRCQATLTAMQPRFAPVAGCELVMRIGLNTGPAVVGNMGSRSRFDYTMLGDAVNLASRLEGANKEFGTRTMASRETFEAAGEASGNIVPGRELALLRVAGRKEPTSVFEPMPREEALARSELLGIFASGLAAFKAGNISLAKERFGRIAADDPPAAAYLRYCEKLPEPLPEDWAGVWIPAGK